MEVVMTRKSTIIALALAATVGVTALAVSSAIKAQPYGSGWGMMGGPGPGYGHMGGYGPMHGGYGPGWMHGYGPGWMHGGGPGYGPCAGLGGPGAYGPQANLNLTTDQVKNQLESWIARQGNPHIKVGEVKEKDADTIEADIVTKDNSLVQRFVVDRHTGFYRPSGS
jgi:hypothetical protein